MCISCCGVFGSQWRFDRGDIGAWIQSGQAAKPETKPAERS
jgi:hypothetical protein